MKLNERYWVTYLSAPMAPPTTGSPDHIVCVCTGNLCRSPIAAGLLRKALAARGHEVWVSSMGVHAEDGRPAHEFAVAACAALGVDISGHRSRGLVPQELAEAALVLVMEDAQREYLTNVLPHLKGRVGLLGAYPQRGGRKHDIADPMGRKRGAFDALARELAGHCERIAEVVGDGR